MSINHNFLKNPRDIIDELADKDTMEKFKLDDILVDISLKIINYRIENDLTQKQLSEELNISQAMVSKLESGHYNPTVGQLWKISKRLNWEFKIILSENKKPI